ncbi:AAA family ATPase [Mycolicibacillus trivialis]
MTVPVDAPEASAAHATPIPLTAERMHYAGAAASGEFTPEELSSLKELADEADARIVAMVGPAAPPWTPVPPATLEAWSPFIREHVELAPLAPAEGSACACPGNADIVLHVGGCAQKATGQAQPYGDDFCAEYDLEPNTLVTATKLAAALRGISEEALRGTMELEVEDREFTEGLPQLAGRAATEPLFTELRSVITADEYDAVLDGLDLNDVDAVVDRLRARLAEAKAATRPALPGEVEELREAERQVTAMRAAGLDAAADSAAAALDRMRQRPQYRVRVTEPAATPPASAFTVPPAPGAVPPASGSAPVAVAPAGTPDADAYELAAARTALETDPEDLFAAKTVERHEERAQLALDLAPYLDRIGNPIVRELELKILMEMTLADRAEAADAALSGRLHRLGLTISKLDPAGKTAQRAWLRLREGAAGKWSVSDLTPMSDAELDAVLNRETPPPTWLNLFYDRGQHILAGPGGCGKTWVALAICKAAVPAIKIPGGEQGPFAVYLDLDQNYELHRRLRDLGLGRDALRSHDVAAIDVAAYAAERGEGVIAALRAIIDGLVKQPPKVVVLDSLTRIIAETDGDGSNSSDAITRALNMLNALSKVSCVIVLDHTGHENPDRPAGAGAKIHTSRVVLTMKPLASDSEEYPNTIASAVVVQTKDRDGGLRQHLAPGNREPRPEIGMLVVDRDEAEGGRTEVRFIPAFTISAAKERRQSDEGVAIAHEAHDAIVETVKGAAEPMSQRAIEDVVWPKFADRKGFTRSDLRAVVGHMIQQSKELVESGSGRGGGKRYTVAE